MQTKEAIMIGTTGNGSSIRRSGSIPALAFLLLLAPAWPAMAGQASGTALVFAGSGTNLPIVRELARAFEKRHPDIRIEVPASIGTASGIRAAADGAIAIGLVSRPLKESEKGLGLAVVRYARTPLVIGVHPAVAEDNISYAEIIDIYRGKKNRWQNGNGIIVLTREPGDSTIEVMDKGVPGFRAVYDESQRAKRWTTILKDLEMNEVLVKTPYAIGFSDLGALKIERHRIKPLRVNGVAPTLANAENGSYPLLKPLAFVYHRGKLSPAAREFLAFVRSREGARIMRANGCLPE
jgi:phosphate transport system substrate-binding protein